MKKILALILLGSFGFAQKTDIANYAIQAELFPSKKMVEGSETLSWTNTSSKPVKELQFHLYMNAFKDKNSSYFKEQSTALRFDSKKNPPKEELGNITIKQIYSQNKQRLSYSFIQPDDLNKEDQTVMKVDLPLAIKSGETVQLKINFEVKLPKMIARTGWDKNDFFFIGQWFPKVAVIDKNGSWNCHQFHANTEFFADFGTYNVQLTVPNDFKVAATGVEKVAIKLKDQKTKYQFSAEKVHDFAWVSSPNFLFHTENYKGIKIKTYLMPEHSNLQSRYSRSIKEAIDYMQAHVGKYPHPVINIIDPPVYASESAGMEYPMLISCGSTWGLGKNIRMQEVVTIHEFVHQYFQGILASNEFENSWMDEGFTQYYEGKIMEKYYGGSQFSFLGFELNDLQTSRDGYVSMKFPEIESLRKNAWLYPSGTYGILSYQKPATFLKTLENHLGEAQLETTMKAYFERLKFRHPEPEDFIEIVNSTNPQMKPALKQFLNDAIYTSGSCDYSIKNLNKESIEISKEGNLNLPVKLLIVFVDGSKKEMMVNKSQYLVFKKPIASATLDPEYKNWMDLNWINNSKSSENTNSPFALKYGSKWMFWLQNLWI